MLVPQKKCPCLPGHWTDPAPQVRFPCGLTINDYRHLFLQLLPRGEVWPRDPDSVQVKLLEAFAALFARPATGQGVRYDATKPRFSSKRPRMDRSGSKRPAEVRVEERVCRLLDELDPRLCDELLGRWEAWLGLPDLCMPKVTGLPARRQRVAAKEKAVGGATPAYFRGLAALLGFDIVIEELFPLGAGCLRAGQRPSSCGCCGWVVHVRCVELEYGVTLEAAIAMLECLFHRLKPAHTTLLFRYASSPCQTPGKPDPCIAAT